MNKSEFEAAMAHATESQARYLEAYFKEGTYRKAAETLGVNNETVRRSVLAAQARAARKGEAPGHFNHGVAPGYAMGKVTIQRGKGGNVERTWERQSPEQNAVMEAIQAASEAIKSEIQPSPPVEPPSSTESELLNLYIITDYHLGAKAWGEETGGDWDMEIAEDLLVKWFYASIAVSPKSKTAVLAQLGDFLHFDGVTAVTPTSGHILDADTRFQKVIRVAIRVIRRVVAMLLSKHETVHIIMAEGNHDISSSMWLRELFAALYESEPRVTVDTRPDPYYCVEHGATSLFFHHGHKRKISDVETVFVAKFREVFGRTKHSYAHTGHLHHNVSQERNTMQIEQHRTLAAPDSHASRGGWISGRDSKVITYSKEYGEVGRVTVSPEMVLKGD